MAQNVSEAVMMLKAMFQNFDDDVLKETLQDNDGDLQLTIDVLLKLTSSETNAAAAGNAEAVTSAKSRDANASTATASETMRNGQNDTATKSATRATVYVPSFRRRKQRVQLPPGFLDGFLRPSRRRASSTQEDEDAILARMLQNRMYMQELNQLPEFRGYIPSRDRLRAQGTVAGSSNDAAGVPDRPSDSRNFWKSLSSSARKKWDQLASQFRRQRANRRPSSNNDDPPLLRALDSEGGAAVYENLLQEDDTLEPLDEDADRTSAYRPPKLTDTSATTTTKRGIEDDNDDAEPASLYSINDDDDDDDVGRLPSGDAIMI